MARGMSLRAAINGFCRQCLYDPREPGGWREQVEACTALDCALFPVRPLNLRRDRKGKKAPPIAKQATIPAES